MMKAGSKLSRGEYILRMCVIIFATLAPYICILGSGYYPSISAYWNTPMQPIFILANATTSYFLYSIPSWRISAFFLLLLTAFSMDMYMEIHNVLAVIFFIVTIIPLTKATQKWPLYLYLSAIIVLPWSMLIAEIVCITALCLHHGMLLYRLNKIFRSGEK